MQVCSSGTMVLILETDGLLCVQVANVLAFGPHIALACSERTHSTSVKGAGARTSTVANLTWLAGDMLGFFLEGNAQEYIM